MSVVISARGFSASVLSVCDGRRKWPCSGDPLECASIS